MTPLYMRVIGRVILIKIYRNIFTISVTALLVVILGINSYAGSPLSLSSIHYAYLDEIQESDTFSPEYFDVSICFPLRHGESDTSIEDRLRSLHACGIDDNRALELAAIAGAYELLRTIGLSHEETVLILEVSPETRIELVSENDEGAFIIIFGIQYYIQKHTDINKSLLRILEDDAPIEIESQNILAIAQISAIQAYMRVASGVDEKCDMNELHEIVNNLMLYEDQLLTKYPDLMIETDNAQNYLVVPRAIEFNGDLMLLLIYNPDGIKCN